MSKGSIPLTRQGVALVTGIALITSSACWWRHGEAPVPATYTVLDVGLTADERATFWHLSEGSDLFPVDVLRALEDRRHGGRFIETMERYGFLPSARNPSNPEGLPVGWAARVPPLSPKGLPYIGINCAACHTGEIVYGDTRMRIDGAPNMVDLERWGLALRDSLLATLEDPGEALRFFIRLARFTLERKANGSTRPATEAALPSFERLRADAELSAALGGMITDAFEGDPADLEARLDALSDDLASGTAALERDGKASVDALVETVRLYLPLLENRLAFALRAVTAIETSPAAGPGRDDPWGIIRNLVFASPTRLDAPTSIPSLFHAREIDWFHADGNTTSILDRNIAQAIALGAYVDAATQVGTFLPANIETLQAIVSKIESPAWPESVLPPIDRELARRGAEIFRRPMAVGVASYSCQHCHDSFRSQLWELDVVGTDANRARSFQRPQGGVPFPRRIEDTIGRVRDATFADHGLEPVDRGRATPEWRATGRYVSRRLAGVWATAPYLHNGSVPTLYDLLLPAARRPATFQLGDRTFDPRKVGYVTESSAAPFLFDTREEGSSNGGHAFGTDLSDDERWALVEYLKTL